MAEELKDLIEKIQREGVLAAEEKAKKTEEEARRKAQDIISKAKADAVEMVADAKERIAKIEASSKSSLRQASRDILIATRKEINAMLDRLIASHVHKAMTTEELARIIINIVKECGAEEKGEVVINIRKEDIEKLERSFLSELKEETKKGITLRPSEDMRGGFTISYDKGRSYYDFTDKALAEYIAAYIKPKIGEILKESAI